MKIISRRGWGARKPQGRVRVPWSLRTEVIIHYTAGPVSQSVKSIQNFHMDTRGWLDIGYNWLVDQQGRVYRGRGWKTRDAHAAGHNVSGIGIAWIGDPDTRPTRRARIAIRKLYRKAKRRARRRLQIRGHRDVSATDCPGPDLSDWLRGGLG